MAGHDEFDRDPERAKEAASEGPVIIMEEDQPSYVFMTYSHFERLRAKARSLIDRLSMPGLSDIELDVDRDRKG
ncbi:hypothetical protein BTR14_06060 [Rhizobium rhizosphaerae]|uniref:Uncharacterized protein n=1 Tax=Xaviernesmea rhizosphaerae TaxID=1672749 RepID=A0ABX3PG28_9HYPH|nr:hypothetical protein [Xaviernesmea rhizosphaerae]OQP87489.1 hypothetical protein BTR14_06060 [Xaviernesmea rhizosphaerae]